jgi:hypothetical protein
MNTFFRRGRVVALLAVFLLVVAACGDDDSGNVEQAPTAPPGAQVSDPLPVNDNPGDTPAVSSACFEDEPDCQDTLVGNPEPQDLPPPSDDEPGTATGGGATVSGGALVDGGLTVSEALATDATSVLAVHGFLLDDGSGARLCELLAESYPPQCGGAFVPVTNYEEVIGVPLSNAQGVTWTDSEVTVFGEIIDGTLVVDPMVAG